LFNLYGRYFTCMTCFGIVLDLFCGTKFSAINILEFIEKFENEFTCKAYLLDIRLREGVTCKHCGSKKQDWLTGKWQFQCSSCSFRTTLRSGTV